MIPNTTTKTILSISLSKGPKAEHDLTNQQFLDSFLEYTCWLRMISARQQLSVMESYITGIHEKLAALATFYQVAGMIVEDALSSYIAWSIWARDKALLIPNILERLSLKLGEPSTPIPINYPEEIFLKIHNTKKRVDVYARDYLLKLMEVSDEKLPQAFGIEWKNIQV